MDALQSIRERRSVRCFSGQEIAMELLERVIDAARLAPTACNRQPWEFVVVTTKEMLKRLGQVAEHGRFIADAAACVVVFCQPTKYYLEDGSAATENILLAAEALGISSCWVAGDKKQYTEEIRGWLGLPGGYKLVSLIALGYAQQLSPAPPKRILEDVLHWEQFSAK